MTTVRQLQEAAISCQGSCWMTGEWGAELKEAMSEVNRSRWTEHGELLQLLKDVGSQDLAQPLVAVGVLSVADLLHLCDGSRLEEALALVKQQVQRRKLRNAVKSAAQEYMRTAYPGMSHPQYWAAFFTMGAFPAPLQPSV